MRMHTHTRSKVKLWKVPCQFGIKAHSHFGAPGWVLPNTRDFLSHMRIVDGFRSSLVIHTNHQRCMWAPASQSPTETPLPGVYTKTFILPLSNPHIMTQYVITWHIIYWYTPVVKGSRCWLLRMSPIVPLGITQRYVRMTVAETLCVFSPPRKYYTFNVANLQAFLHSRYEKS